MLADSLEIERWIPGESPAIQMLWLSKAYSEAAELLCNALVEDQFTRQYQSTRVVLHLCRHAAELFFKGAIAHASKLPPPQHHDLGKLNKEYETHFPLEEHAIHLPFSEQVLDLQPGLFPGSLKEFQRTHDQRYRYITDKTGNAFDMEVFDALRAQTAIDLFHHEIGMMVARISFGGDC